MTKRKRLISAILTLVLFLNMVPAVNAAEGDPGRLTMTASADTITHGDNVTVTVSASRSFSVRGTGITVSYDSNILEPILENCRSAAPLKISGPITVRGETVLRISFFPGSESHFFTADQVLAVLTFRSIASADFTRIEMDAAYHYDSGLNRIDLKKADPVQIHVKALPVTGIILYEKNMELEIQESKKLRAEVQPANASDKTIIWTSSDESIVTVKDGVLTGIRTGTAVVTANASGFAADCIVKVVYPPDAGYVVIMPSEKSAVAGDTVTISPYIDNGAGIDVYNAYDITVSYDPSMLLLTSTRMEDITVTQGEGSINLIHYGPDQKIGTKPFSLTFQAKKTGETTVTVSSARIDQSENALISNAARAALYPGETKVTIGGYTVSLPDAFRGDAVAKPGADYTFEAKDKLYEYTFTGSTMGGQSVTVRDNGDGTYTVENVTGKLIICIDPRKTIGKAFDVVLGTDMTGEATARYMTDYSANLHEDENYTYTVHVTIGGNYYNGYSKSGDTYSIPGKDITGKIIFTVTKTEIGTNPPSSTWYDVTFEGSGAGAAEGCVASVADGSSYVFRLNKEEGYRYSVTYKMGDAEEKTIRPDSDGNYTIKNVKGDLVITITKELDEQDYSVEVYSYVTLNDGNTVYLVLVTGGLDDSKVFTYGEISMYYSESYRAWCLLTVESSKLTASLARKQIGSRTGQMDAVGLTGYDVNMTGLVDINDAQLVYDIYNGKYEDFSEINMHRFLNADVNADKKVTVNDAAGVVSEIK
ncbi:MAG: Ig-like domain-containing protein [Oscillospiraceae bacterium]|nr:Ig-like domain-containing protein [Oscillospiraceae bacterium]